jgi:hypothetical protein
MMKIIGLTAIIGLITFHCARAGEGLFEVFFGSYFHRIEGVTVGAGDAKDVNAASEIIDPWPRNVWTRRIPSNGPRMVGAIERYQDVRKLKEAAPPLAPVDSVSGAGASVAH